MIFIAYNHNLETLARLEQHKSPKLSQLKVDNPVLAFDQSTKATGITVGDSSGTIHGFIRLIKEDSKETGIEYIANFQTWLNDFIDIEPAYMLYEYTFSKNYFRTDVILSQLRGVFTTLKESNNWKFPIEVVKQQEWKSAVLQLKESGSRQLSKENAHQVILSKICPTLPYEDRFEDIYDSIGIYYYYVRNFMNMDLSAPIDINLKWKTDDNLDIECSFYVGKNPTGNMYTRIANNRGIRYFNYHYKLTPRENIKKLASNSNELWIARIPIEGNPNIDLILPHCERLPKEGESIFLMGYRRNSKQFKKRLL